MDLSKKLQKVREKPTHVKERILMITIAFFIAITLTVWVTNFSFSSFNFKDTGVLINSTKEYFSNSKGYIFDEAGSDKMINSLKVSTSTGALAPEENTSTTSSSSTNPGIRATAHYWDNPGTVTH